MSTLQSNPTHSPSATGDPIRARFERCLSDGRSLVVLVVRHGPTGYPRVRLLLDGTQIAEASPREVTPQLLAKAPHLRPYPAFISVFEPGAPGQYPLTDEEWVAYEAQKSVWLAADADAVDAEEALSPEIGAALRRYGSSERAWEREDERAWALLNSAGY